MIEPRNNLGIGSGGNGFSKERMDLFQKIINVIKEVTLETGDPLDIDSPMFPIPDKADREETIKKAIVHYAVPNGICIVEDLVEYGYRWIRTKEEYAEYVSTIGKHIEELQESKRMAAAAWMNDRRAL